MIVRAFIPWAEGSCAERVRSKQIVEQYYRDNFPGWQAELAVGPLDFPRAKVCNEKARSTSCDVLVFNDADSIVPPAQLRQAAERAAVRAEWGTFAMVRAYTVYRRISEAQSAKVHNWQDVLRCDDIVWEQEHTVSHGVLAIHRESFLRVGGYDPRFHYFYDDCSFDIRATETIDQVRIPGPLYHLWHPAREPWPDDEALWRRYEREDPAAVRAEVGW